MSIDWSKAPAHATHWCPGNAKIEAGWIHVPGGGEFYSCYADKGLEHIPGFPAWRALKLIPRPKEIASWAGEGLPPAGTVCEIKGCKSHYLQWNKVTVFAVRGGTVFFDMEDGRWGQTDSHEIRPIRTPEQIAEEEREAEIETLRVLLSKVACDDYHAAVAVFEAGYRKQPAP